MDQAEKGAAARASAPGGVVERTVERSNDRRLLADERSIVDWFSVDDGVEPGTVCLDL